MVAFGRWDEERAVGCAPALGYALCLAQEANGLGRGGLGVASNLVHIRTHEASDDQASVFSVQLGGALRVEGVHIHR